MKKSVIYLTLILISSCRVIDFTIDKNVKIYQHNLISLFYNKKIKYDNYEKIIPYIFFKDGTYFDAPFFYSTKKIGEAYKNENIYARKLLNKWGIYTLENDSTIISESINNVEYLTGPPTSALPLYDTLYTEKFVFKNDTTLLRYDKPNANWRLRDTLYLNKDVDISFIDPSKAWIYKKMLPYPYWEKKNKASKK